MILLLLTGGLTAAIFAFDASRLTSDAAQLKRATDAAALAVSQAHARDTTINVQAMAERYVKANLGMDAQQTSDALEVRLAPVETSEGKGYRVSARFRASPLLPGAVSQRVDVSSAAIARYAPLEVALVLPNTVSESRSDIEALKRLGKMFAQRLLKDAGEDSTMWLSLVPYSQSVNVFDASDTGRLVRWARADALRPGNLIDLWRSGKANSLADQRIPDRRANLLCMYRGLGAGKNFAWDQSPLRQFKIYFRIDEPENGSPGATPISWIGTEPLFGGDAEDTRWMVADIGCPNAPLLPLTNEVEKINARLDQMSIRFNTNYAIAMGWAGASLSPAMRGSAGWGNAKLPLDFNEDDSQSNKKVVIMLANTIGNWFDTDSYNADVGASVGSAQLGSDGSRAFARQRFIDLCQDFRARNLQFHFLGVRPGQADDIGRTLFGQFAVPGLSICTGGKGSLQFTNASGIAAGEALLTTQLEKIADDLKRDSSFSRLIE